jgi:small subunit ribosomal protein S6
MTSQEARKYQLDFHLLNEDFAPVSALLKKHGIVGEVVSSLKKVHLAYPVKKQEYAFFGTAEISVKPEVLPALDRELILSDAILRFSLVKPGKPEAERKPRAPKPETATKSDSLPTRIRPFDDATLSNEALESKLKEISQ